MKLALILCLLFLFSSFQSKTWFIWHPDSESNTEKVIQENPDITKFLPHNSLSELKQYLSDFHLLDIDKDGDMDLVYSGSEGGNKSTVKFFINKNNKFQPDYTFLGKLTAIQATAPDVFRMYIMTSALNGKPENMEHEIKMTVLRDSLLPTILRITVFHESAPMPAEHFDPPVYFLISETQYPMNLFPESGSPGDLKRNVYHTYSPGDKGAAYAQKQDKQNKTWWYVIMEPVLSDTNSIVFKERKIIPRYAGWMKQQYLVPMKAGWLEKIKF